MKRIITILAMIITTASFAQKKMQVQEGSANIAGGNNNAFTILIFEADQKLVEKDWKSEMKDMGAKVTTKKEMFGDDAKLKAIGDNTFDIYAITKSVDGGTELTVAIDMGGAFMSSGQHATQAKVIKDVIYNFAVATAKEAIGDMLKDEEKILKGLEKEQEDLVKGKEKLEKSIKDNEAAIEQAKKDIEQAKKDIEGNAKDQDKKKQEIEKQKKVVQDVAAKEAAVK